MREEDKTTLSVSRDVSIEAKARATAARLSLYEYVNQALSYAAKNMRITIRTKRKSNDEESMPVEVEPAAASNA